MSIINTYTIPDRIISGPSSGEKFVGNVWWKIPEGNITFRNYKDLVEWSAATGQEKLNGVIQGKQVDPLMAGPFTIDLTDPHELKSLHGFTLKHETTVKAGGVNLNYNFNLNIPARDFFGNAIKKYTTTPGIHELSK